MSAFDVPPGPELGPAPHLRVPNPAKVFAARAARFERLAAEHSLRDYLAFLAALTRAQGEVCASSAPFAADGERHPLDAVRLARELPSTVGALVDALDVSGLPAAACIAASLARSASPASCAELVAAFVEGAPELVDPSLAPFVLGALGARLVPAAATLQVAQVEPGLERCPVCAAPPVAAAILGDDPLRYVVCGLCASEWNVTRVKCVSCGGTAGIGYLELEGGDGAVKAETCDGCKAYLKLFYLERRPEAVVFADDVATLALDVLCSEEGFGKVGAHPFLVSRG